MTNCGPFILIPKILDPCNTQKNNKNIKSCPNGLPPRARGCNPSFPTTVTGFPFSGNTNNPGSLINSVNRCATKLKNPRLGLRENILKNNELDEFKRRSGVPGGKFSGIINI